MIEKFQNLSVLAKAIHFQNLTTASQHVGLSQPQLSRVIQGLEEKTGLTLLDRSVKRNAKWTKSAQELVELYLQADHRFSKALHEMTSEQIHTDLRIACLEGLVDFAVAALGRLLPIIGSRTLWLDVLDQSELEERLLADSVDLAWTSRVPGKRKPRYLLQLGWQNLVERTEGGKRTRVVSSFEYAQLGKDKQIKDQLLFVSNSLRARESWISKNGGVGQFPSRVLKVNERGLMPVLIVGSETMSHRLWEKLRKVTSE